jgi:hypothetical protein
MATGCVETLVTNYEALRGIRKTQGESEHPTYNKKKEG